MGEWAGSVRAGAHGGAARAMHGVGQGARVGERLVHPAGVLTAWEGQLCVA